MSPTKSVLAGSEVLDSNFSVEVVGVEGRTKYHKVAGFDSSQKSFPALLSNLPVSDVLGCFHSDLHYLKVLQFLFMQTQETDNRRMFIQSVVDACVSQKHHILEVGVGDGDVSSIVCRDFEKVTLVDPNQRALNSVTLSRALSHCEVKKIASDIRDTDLGKKAFDCAILSQVMYYMNYSSWVPCFKKVRESLKENGLMLVSLSGGGSKEKIADFFGGELCSIHALVSDIMLSFPDAELHVFDFEEECGVDDLNSALLIASVYLNDAGIEVKKVDMIDYLSKSNKIVLDSGKTFFKFNFIQRFVLVRRV